jgi:hypothetical protein
VGIHAEVNAAARYGAVVPEGAVPDDRRRLASLQAASLELGMVVFEDQVLKEW